MVHMFQFLNADRRHLGRVINNQDNAIANQNNTIGIMQGQLNAANAAIAAAVAAPAAPVNRVKIQQPKKFSGTQSEARPFL
jgi:hypothetical protein